MRETENSEKIIHLFFPKAMVISREWESGVGDENEGENWTRIDRKWENLDLLPGKMVIFSEIQQNRVRSDRESSENSLRIQQILKNIFLTGFYLIWLKLAVFPGKKIKIFSFAIDSRSILTRFSITSHSILLDFTENDHFPWGEEGISTYCSVSGVY